MTVKFILDLFFVYYYLRFILTLIRDRTTSLSAIGTIFMPSGSLFLLEFIGFSILFHF